jgi:hypothetical protein
MKSHIKECFGFVPVREFGEFLRSGKIDYLYVSAIAGAGFFWILYILVRGAFRG